MKAVYRFFIGFYQRRLSPHKGYRCAYSLENGGPSCSGAVLQILENKGLRHGWADICRRFQECSESAEQRKRRREKQKRNEGAADCACDVYDLAFDGRACLPKRDCDVVPDCSSGCDCDELLHPIATQMDGVSQGSQPCLGQFLT